MTRRIVVVGGGIAGLAAAHRLTELQQANALDLEVLLLEGSTRLGGAIATERIGDFLVDAGPDSFITEKPWALRLCERLGLASRLVATQSAYQKIYVVHQGTLQPLPNGFFLLAPTRFWPFVKTPIFSWSGKLRMAAEILLPRGKTHADESLGSFVRRRFGVEALERIAQPLIGGIYASDPDRLSLGAGVRSAKLDDLVARCTPAPFGKGKKTLFDRSVRDARQLKAEGGAFSVAGFDPVKSGVLEAVRRELVPHEPNSLTAELYCLNVYSSSTA
jgi:protoporphyrinogen oxidase